MTNTKQEALELVKESVAKSRRESDLDWTEIKDKHLIFEHSSDILRRYGRAWHMLEDWGLVDFSQVQSKDLETPSYKESVELKKDGSQLSDKLIDLSATEMKDEETVLKAHGYNPDEWEIINAKHSMYNVNAKGGITKTLYSSKITVKKKVDSFNVDTFLKKIEKIKPVHVERPTHSTKRMLSVPFVDQHFGINTLADYKRKLEETIEIFESKQWDTIYIPLGNDLLHNNNHKGHTANGTPIELVNMEQAKEDAYAFYVTIIESALKNAVNVVVDYVPGNHDLDMTWMFISMLAKQYPQVKWNTSIDAKKLFRWENILLVNLHGDKGINRVAKTLVTEYRDLMVGAKTVEIHSGHLHSQKVNDEYGILVRTLPTDAKTDDWHRDNSFEGAVKVSQLFEYNENILKTIHHV